MRNVSVANPIDGGVVRMTARSEGTRTGFRHLAETSDGVTAKMCYLNRTWEVYAFQSVLHKLAWNWLVRRTGWNPDTKRDGARFREAYGKMTGAIDAACSPS